MLYFTNVPFNKAVIHTVERKVIVEMSDYMGIIQINNPVKCFGKALEENKIIILVLQGSQIWCSGDFPSKLSRFKSYEIKG